jgi:hypothetical protein
MMSKFQVGDRVEVRGYGLGHPESEAWYGVGVITSKSSIGYKVEFDGRGGSYYSVGSFPERYLTPALEYFAGVEFDGDEKA